MALPICRMGRPAGHAICLHKESGVQTVGECELTLARGDKDLGVIEIAPSKFKWTMSKSGWLTVAGLIKPFCLGNSAGYQWLSEDGDISVLLSDDGQW
jgi:hypothetical protein